MKKGFMDFFAQASTDLLCIQEVKIIARRRSYSIDLPDEYEQYWNLCPSVPAYSGTAVFYKRNPYSINCSLNNEEVDGEGRVIIMDYGSFYVLNVYIPNAQYRPGRMDFRLAWDEVFFDFVSELSLDKPIIICGDFNCTLRDDDIRKTIPRTMSQKLSEETRFNILNFMNQHGFVDAYREMHPDTIDAYTWWSYRRSKCTDNVGWRFDYFLISRCLLPQVIDCGIYSDVLGSDHCPIYLEINI